MSCGSCERIIEKVAERNGAKAVSIDANTGIVVLSCVPEKIAEIKERLAQKGFHEKGEEGSERGDPERVFTYLNAIAKASEIVGAESVLINYSIAGLLASSIAIWAGYMLFFVKMANAAAYLPLLALAVFSSVASVYSYNNVKCYGKNISCTNGMMAGMILGMIPGFMTGAIIGATNGMFLGSIVGMTAGIVLGIKAGKCCGIMGAMEGVMAGFMAGIMGAMTSVMMFSDHLLEFLFIAFAICGAMLFGMSYLLHREIGTRDKNQVGISMQHFVALSVAFSIIMAIIMFYGPKGPLTFT